MQREIDSVNELLANVGGRKNNVDPLGLESDMEVIDYSFRQRVVIRVLLKIR